MLASASRGGVCLVCGVSAWFGGSLVLGGCLPGPGGLWSRGAGIPACTEADPPLWTESQTPIKTLPWPNFVAAGKNQYSSSSLKKFCGTISKKFISFTSILHSKSSPFFRLFKHATLVANRIFKTMTSRHWHIK